MKLKNVRKAVEAYIGGKIPDAVASEVLDYAKRKCMATGKPSSYLPILYEDELLDFFRRTQINMMGDDRYVLWVS